MRIAINKFLKKANIKGDEVFNKYIIKRGYSQLSSNTNPWDLRGDLDQRGLT